MHPSGLAAFERRREDRSEIYSYEKDGQPARRPTCRSGWLPTPQPRLLGLATPTYRSPSSTGCSGQAGGHPRQAAGAAHRRLRPRTPDPQPALRRDPQVGGASRRGGPGCGASRGGAEPATRAAPRVGSVGYTEVDRERWVREDPVTKRADRDDFARDRARLVHSASLRRLSAKTQVVQPGDDDFVRNRLTHCSRWRRSAASSAPRWAATPTSSTRPAWPMTSATRPSATTASRPSTTIAADIGGFEGNAQTLRLLTRLEPKRVRPDGRPAGSQPHPRHPRRVDQVPLGAWRKSHSHRQVRRVCR